MKMTRYEQQRHKNLSYIVRQNGREERTPLHEIDNLLQLTYDPDPQVRCEAARDLCPCHVQANHQRVWDRLMAMAEDPDVKVRKTVLHTLGDGSPRERETDVVATLEKMYHDPDDKLRRQVRKLLAQYRRSGKINVL